jgi:hypothetical protein
MTVAAEAVSRTARTAVGRERARRRQVRIPHATT